MSFEEEAALQQQRKGTESSSNACLQTSVLTATRVRARDQTQTHLDCHGQHVQRGLRIY